MSQKRADTATLRERCETQVEKDEAILLLKLFYQKTVEGNKGRV